MVHAVCLSTNFCSYFWGALSDRKGRKLVLVVSSICMAVCILAFGFSINFAMAVALRFINGLLDGKACSCLRIVHQDVLCVCRS